MATVTIDDELGHLLTRVASARGKTLEQFADEALRRVISENGGVHRTVRNGLPVMLVCDQRATIPITKGHIAGSRNPLPTVGPRVY